MARHDFIPERSPGPVQVIRPAVIVDTVDEGFSYVGIIDGQRFEILTNPGANNPFEGEMVLPRRVLVAKQLFLASSELAMQWRIAGSRVYLALITNASGVGTPKLVRTDAVRSTPTVTWVDISTGLPGTDVCNRVPLHVYNPFNSLEGIMAIRRSSGEGADAIYKITDQRGSGSASLIFDLSTLNSVLGRSDTDLDIEQIAYTITANGWFYILGSTNGLKLFIAHTEDGGGSWIIYTTGLLGSNPIDMWMVVSQRSATRVFLAFVDLVGLPDDIIRESNNSGSSWSTLLFSSGIRLGGYRHLYVPYEGNADENEQYFWTRRQTTDRIWRTRDRWSSRTMVYDESQFRKQIMIPVPGRTQSWVGARYPPSPSEGFYRSDDDISTETLVGTGTLPSTFETMSVLREGLFYHAAAGNPFTHSAWGTEENREGNLDPLVGANRRIGQITVDGTR